MSMRPKKYDVIILGSGWAGTLLGAILAKHGVGVMILDYAKHPRFAIGESTSPQTSQLMTLLAIKYKIPEFNTLGMAGAKKIAEEVSTRCGIKRTFSYLYHRFGEPQDPTETQQFGNIWRAENHLFREDVDQYLLNLAKQYGANAEEEVRILDVATDDATGVVVDTDRLGRLTADYVVDGTGFRSILAAKYDLRDSTEGLFDTHSRSVFTHMENVTPFEDVTPNYRSIPWSQSTVHHIFKRGWFWIIPFNNQECSTNPIVSVGLQLDPRHHPDSDESPEEEFFSYVDRLPDVKRQFANAVAIRPWIRTGRLQYTSKQNHGPRFSLMAHSSSFVDPIFSRGLIMSVEVVDGLAERLLQCFEDQDYSQQRFECLDAMMKRNVTYTDQLVNGCYIAFDSFDLWNAWMRVWAAGAALIESTLGGYLITRMLKDPVEDPISSRFEYPGFREFFEKSYATILRYERGEMTGDAAAQRLFAIHREFDYVMKLPDVKLGPAEWALKNPDSRDLYLGNPMHQERWANQQSDPVRSSPGRP